VAESVSLLRADRDLAQVLGQEFLTVYAEIKDLEHEEFMRVISPWEREHLLLHV
jgi:glutamine synthetase